MLKRYDIPLFTILMLLLAASLVSCEKESHEPASDKTPIKFGKVETRAPVNLWEDMKGEGKGDGFGVFANVSGAENPPLLENENVYWNGSLWTYDKTKYWISDHTFHFFAYYPYFDGEEAITSVVANGNGEVGYQLTFETPEKADVDLLSAYIEVDTGADDFDASSYSVPLAFNHELVNLNLNIWRDDGKHQNDQMRIRKVTLSNIRKGGTYSSNTDRWEPSDDRLTLEKIYEGGADYDNIGGATVQSNGTLITGGVPAKPFTGVMLVPQTLDGSSPVSLKIQYELKRQNAADWEQAELETVLPSVTWEPNRRYTYNVVLSSVTDITVYYIQTKVDPWGTPQVGGTVIIK